MRRAKEPIRNHEDQKPPRERGLSTTTTIQKERRKRGGDVFRFL